MGKDWSNDERVRTGNGNVSRTRIIAIEGLEAQGREGATLDELAALVGQDIGGEKPKQGLSKSLNGMAVDGYVIFTRGRWYLKECAPDAPKTHLNGSNSSAALSPAMNGHKAQIAPFVGKRTGKTISVYTSPRVFEDAIALSLFVGGRWFKIPLSGSARVCYGQEAPQWSPDQEMYNDVEVLKIQLRNGQFHEERPAPTDIVTVLLE